MVHNGAKQLWQEIYSATVLPIIPAQMLFVQILLSALISGWNTNAPAHEVNVSLQMAKVALIATNVWITHAETMGNVSIETRLNDTLVFAQQDFRAITAN